MGGQSSKQSPYRDYAITQNRYNELMSNTSKLTNRQKASLKAPRNRRFQYNTNGQIINTNHPSTRVNITEGKRKNGTTFKLHSYRPGYTNKNFNRNHMQMNLGEAEDKLTALKDQYANNPLAMNEIDHALSELKGIKTLRVSEEEKRRKVAHLAETKTKLAQKDKFENHLRDRMERYQNSCFWNTYCSWVYCQYINGRGSRSGSCRSVCRYTGSWCGSYWWNQTSSYPTPMNNHISSFCFGNLLDSQNKTIRKVGFEPTQISPVDLKSTALTGLCDSRDLW